MKKILMTIFFALAVMNASAQTLITRNGRVTFYSKAPIENIEAVNNEVSSIIDAGKSEVVFAVLIKSFKFKKALM